MRYESEYCVLALEIKGATDGVVDKFHVGDEVSIYKEGIAAFTGTITLITVKGIYLDVGNKKDKYFRLNEITEIYRSGVN